VRQPNGKLLEPKGVAAEPQHRARQHGNVPAPARKHAALKARVAREERRRRRETARREGFADELPRQDVERGRQPWLVGKVSEVELTPARPFAVGGGDRRERIVEQDLGVELVVEAPPAGRLTSRANARSIWRWCSSGNLTVGQWVCWT
jgi:hypothetical protein